MNNNSLVPALFFVYRVDLLEQGDHVIALFLYEINIYILFAPFRRAVFCLLTYAAFCSLYDYQCFN